MKSKNISLSFQLYFRIVLIRGLLTVEFLIRKILLVFCIVLFLLIEISCKNEVPVYTADDFKRDIASDVSEIKLRNDVELDSSIAFSKGISIDLNGNTLTINGHMELVSAEKAYTARFYNGKIITKKQNVLCDYGILISKDTNLVLQSVDFSAVGTSGIFISETASHSSLVVADSTVNASGAFAITTSSRNTEGNVSILIEKSVITASDSNNHDNTAILFDINGTMEIDDSVISAERQAVILRGGNHIITNSTLKATGLNKRKTYLDRKWGSGNEVPLAALVIGNRNPDAYLYQTEATLTDVSIECPDSNAVGTGYYAIYVWQNNGDGIVYPVEVSGSARFADNDKVNIGNMNEAQYSVVKLQ